jgi:hypothetical protein
VIVAFSNGVHRKTKNNLASVDPVSSGTCFFC